MTPRDAARPRPSKAGLFLFRPTACLFLLLATAFPAAGAETPPGRWLPTWVAAQQLTEPHNLPPPPGFEAVTLRQKFRTSIGGRAVRVRFSNAFGDGPLTITAAAIARSTGAGAIDPATSRPLTFRGKPAVTIPAGAEWISDPVDLPLPPMADIAVTITLDGAPQAVTGHPGSRTTTYFAHDNRSVDAPDLSDATRVDHWYFLAGLDVRTEAPEAAAIAILGDSITDGRGSTHNAHNRWPDHLSRRLRANPATTHLAVLNLGIGGNRILHHGLGPSLLARLDRDVLARPGVRWLIILEGINDLGTAAGEREADRPAPTAEAIIAALEQAVIRARDHGIRVIGGTILPYEGAFYYSEQGERDRQQVNQWIRSSGCFDAVIDFDAVARDPAHPGRLAPAFDSGDHLHLSPEGLRHIAEAIDLSLFAAPPRAR